MVALTRHSSSRADPTRRAVMRIPTLVQRVFGSVTVWRSPSLTSLVWAHAKRTAHGEVWSPCAVHSARHEEKRSELGLCQTSRRARARNPGVRTRKKGYASRQLAKRFSHPTCDYRLRCLSHRLSRTLRGGRGAERISACIWGPIPYMIAVLISTA